MYKGFYSAASGLTAQNKALSVTANNVANINTAGFKKDALITKTFGEHMEKQNGNEVGQTTFGVKAEASYTSFEQGALEDTGRALDFGIEGEGFFTVQLPDGSKALTRNGQFAIDGEGYLIAGDGRVLGKKGLVSVGTATIEVGTDGSILLDGTATDTLLLTNPSELTQLVKAGEGFFLYRGETKDPACVVKQRMKERSNVDMIGEMTDMLANSRQLQACGQVIKIFEELMQKSANEVGRL